MAQDDSKNEVDEVLEDNHLRREQLTQDQQKELEEEVQEGY